MATLIIACCICLHSLNDVKSRKKRTRLHEEYSAGMRDVLNKLLFDMFPSAPCDSGVDLFTFKETSHRDAYVCGECRTKLSRIPRLQQQLNEVKSDICQKLKGLHVLGHDSSTRLKRPIDLTSAADSNLSKSARLQTTTLSNRHAECLAEEYNTSMSSPSSAYQGSVVSQPENSSDLVQSQSTTANSPDLVVTIPYPSGTKHYKIVTPTRKRLIKKCAKRTYPSAVSYMAKNEATSGYLLYGVVRKIKEELKLMASMQHNSLLRDTNEAVRQFSWETVWLELMRDVPTLTTFFMKLIPKIEKPLLCFLISIILKRQSSKLCLVQRAISVLLYGNGVSKQVYNCLQPLMICLSHKGTSILIKTLSEDYDVDVQFWADKLQERILLTDIEYNYQRDVVFVDEQYDDDDNNSEGRHHDDGRGSDVYDENDCCSGDEQNYDLDNTDLEEEFYECTERNDDDDNISVTAPPYSPISDVDLDDDFIECNFDENVPQEENCDDVPPENTSVLSAVSPRETEQSTWSGYKLIIDNVDKNIRPSFQRFDHQTRSLHYCHTLAIKDRIDLSHFSDISCNNPVKFSDILPNAQDLNLLKKEFEVFICRVIVQHLTQFSSERKYVQWHIPSEYSKQMKMKSSVVPLGIQLHNESKVDEMCKVLDELTKYIPAKSCTVTHYLPDGEELTLDEVDCKQYPILTGGDQFSVARYRAAQSVRTNDDSTIGRLKGFVPAIEDWHARLTLVKAIWKRLYNKQSSSQMGTLYQLKGLINRTGVPLDPSDNMKAAEDFLLVVLSSHIVAAAKTILASNQSVDCANILAEKVLEKFLRITVPGVNFEGEKTDDSVYLYATELMSIGLIWHGFHDAIKEGDGDRVLRYWKFLLIIFKATQCRNYSKEAGNLLLQAQTLSPRLTAQLKWSRFVNTTGRTGCNIPCDLFLEHMNRRLKTMIRNMGSNVTDSSITQAAASINIVNHVCRQFEKENELNTISSHHPYPTFEKDLQVIVQNLIDHDVFNPVSGRKHSAFQFKHGLLEKYKPDELKEWIKAIANKSLL